MKAEKTENLPPPSPEETTGKLPLIEAVNLGVYYGGEKQKRDDFKSHVHNLLQGDSQNGHFWALKEISFCGYPGDVLGVIGHNGAGKTTLCRVISGLLRPNEGSIHVRGEVSSLLSLGAGFISDLSGRENIILNGMMLGMSRKQINALLPSIQEFSGLGRFLGHPLKHYSSGMKARLGFSVAAALESDILVIDEVLGTGDLTFKKRAAEKIWELVSGARLVLVVTHDTEFVQEHCTRAVWIEKGTLKALGKPGDVITRYQQEASEKAPVKKKIISLSETRIETGEKTAIEVADLGVCFKLDREPFWALQDVSFTVREKEIVGIIGHNGAGKTTLCRVLSGIYRPDRGSVSLNGAVTALLSLKTGFNDQLTGVDNIYLNGMMLGIPKHVIRSLEGEIIEFAELEESIHKPVKKYSKGMRSRLGFSIAAALQPDIFIVDEALNAGDIVFKQKAAAKMQEMLEQAQAVLIVTHSLKIVQRVCTRALWLHEGKVRFDGDPKQAVQLYEESVTKKDSPRA